MHVLELINNYHNGIGVIKVSRIVMLSFCVSSTI